MRSLLPLLLLLLCAFLSRLSIVYAIHFISYQMNQRKKLAFFVCLCSPFFYVPIDSVDIHFIRDIINSMHQSLRRRKKKYKKMYPSNARMRITKLKRMPKNTSYHLANKCPVFYGPTLCQWKRA